MGTPSDAGQIILMMKDKPTTLYIYSESHDIDAVTQAVKGGQLKVAGYKVVYMVPKEQPTTIAKYDEMLDHRMNLSSSAQPVSASGHDAAIHHSMRRR